jgi:hypothetical protein
MKNVSTKCGVTIHFQQLETGTEHQGTARNMNTMCHSMYVQPRDNIRKHFVQLLLHSTAETVYNDITLCDTTSIASGTLWNQLIRQS